MRVPLSLALGIALAACGGGGDGDPDAPPSNPPDAMVQLVRGVTCSGTPAGPVTTPGNSYAPNSVTISAGGQVRFTLGATHNVVSTTPGQVFALPLGADTCLQFDGPGTFTYKCGPHSFTGTVVVQ
jgi:hypothetical protein